MRRENASAPDAHTLKFYLLNTLASLPKEVSSLLSFEIGIVVCIQGIVALFRTVILNAVEGRQRVWELSHVRREAPQWILYHRDVPPQASVISTPLLDL